MDNDDDQEQMYRIQMLQAFDLNEWKDDVIHKTIAELYATLGELPEFKTIFTKARQNKNIQDMLALLSLSGEEQVDTDDIIFDLLFKFEYFDLLHRCIVDYILNNSLHEKHVTNLLNNL
jgi:hypothetical protein